MFDNWHEGHNIWAKECRNCGRNETGKPAQSLALAPGESGYFLLRWKSIANGKEPCTDADGFNTNDVTVVAPSLLDKVCSAVDEQSFLPGDFGASRPDSDPDAGYSVELSTPDSVLRAGDSFPFRAVVSDPKGQLALDDHSCPITFIRTRDDSGGTMFHQISGFSPKCRVSSFGAGRTIEIEMRAPGLGVLNIPGSTSVRFYVLVGPSSAREVALAASNALQMKIIDPATLTPNWGPELAGVAISLVLDKETYKTGEDVPLRINLENFSATQEIGGGELPCGAGLTIEVRDSTGALVPQHGFGWFCSGHGWQTAYPPGKPVIVPRIALGDVRLLPDHPGTYTVTKPGMERVVGASSPTRGRERSAVLSNPMRSCTRSRRHFASFRNATENISDFARATRDRAIANLLPDMSRSSRIDTRFFGSRADDRPLRQLTVG